MERDFMGIRGSDSGGCGGREDSAFSIVQRGLSNKQSSTQQFIPFKSQQEEKPKNAYFDPISSKTSAMQAPQISFGVDGHNVQQFDIHNYQNQEVDNYRSYAHLAPVLPISIPIVTSSSLFKIHGASNGANLTASDVKIPSFGSNNSSLQGAGVGFFTPRNAMISPPTTAQLTIFYAGSVHVYDDIPWDKAQSVMLKASGGCKATTNVAHSIVESPALLLTKGPISEGLKVAQTPKIINSHVVSSCSGLSSSLSLASSKGNQSENGSMTTDDKVGATKIGPLGSTSQDETSMTMNNSMVSATVATIMPRAVPQARKASIARFLEKRKERVSNKVPYSFDKTSEIVPDVAVPFSNCSAPEVSISSKQDFSWFKDHAQNSDDKTNSPNTKLEM